MPFAGAILEKSSGGGGGGSSSRYRAQIDHTPYILRMRRSPTAVIAQLNLGLQSSRTSVILSFIWGSSLANTAVKPPRASVMRAHAQVLRIGAVLQSALIAFAARAIKERIVFSRKKVRDCRNEKH